jgi:hypothetical protein
METPSNAQTPKDTTQTSPRSSNTPVSDVTVDQYTKIVDRAHSEIQQVRSVYKWLAGSLGIILATFIGSATYLTYNTVQEMRSDLADKVTVLSARVEKRIEDEFGKGNIQDLIQKKAEERIDKVADVIIKNHIARSLEPKLKAFETELTSSDIRLAEVEMKLAAKIFATDSKLKTLESGALAELRETSEYVMTVVAAQNDDRKAFDQLKTWADDNSSPFSVRAEQVWNKILSEHATPFSYSGFTVPWTEGVDPSKLSLEELKAAYRSAQPNIRLALLEYIWNREDIAKNQKMAFLVDVMKTDASLQVVEYAARFFMKESNQKIKPLAIDPLLKWWATQE